jgi:hypothetical protein
MRLAFRIGWSAMARGLGRGLARHARLPDPPVGWRKTGGPWFGNQLMTLTMRGRSARLRLEHAKAREGTGPRLTTLLDSELAP